MASKVHQLPPLSDLELLKTNRRRYVQVPRSLIGSDLLEAADSTAKAAASELGIPTPTVRWVAERGSRLAYEAVFKAGGAGKVPVVGPIGCGGWFDPTCPKQITLIATPDLDVGQVEYMVAHECRHAWQSAPAAEIAQAAYKSDTALWEDDADAFADRLLAGWKR